VIELKGGIGEIVRGPPNPKRKKQKYVFYSILFYSIL
jgi:hypothetical protein